MSKKAPAAEPEITKRRVTARSAVLNAVTGGVDIHETNDYVLPEVLDQVVAELRRNWQYVEVSEEPDAGPGGYHGATHIPEFCSHPEAGTTRPATTPGGVE